MIKKLAVRGAKELQQYGTVVRLPIALDVAVCAASVESSTSS